MENQDVSLVADIPGLVAIFGDALYKDFGSIVRELVQNAHDTIVEAVAESDHPTEEIRERRITVEFDAERKNLVVADDGRGMDRSAIVENLNNFAKSQKRETQKSVTRKAKGEASQALLRIVGEYGVGFLSAMAVSERLQVWSRRQGCLPVCWEYKAGEARANVRETSDQSFDSAVRSLRLPALQSGTVVVCELRAIVLEEYGLEDSDIEKSTIQYAALLPVPISFNGQLISCRFTAWANPASATNEEWVEAIRGLHNEEPLLVIPIFSPPNELDVQGVVWIPERRSYFSTPRLDVYVKRMFVVSDDEIIMPTWARFISGMINTNKVRRIVSGNTIKKDRNAAAIREFLKERIIDEFKKLRSRPEREYWTIISPHDDAIKGSAADDDEFRACVWDKIRFLCGDRRLTIPEYLASLERKTGKVNTIYFYDQHKQQHSADLVAEATGVPVLDIDQTRDDVLMRKICGDKNYALRSFRELAEEHFRRPAHEDQFASLIAACAHWNIEAEIRDYSPSHLPAVMIEDQTFHDRRDQLLQGLKKHGEEHFAKDLEKLFRRQRAANFGVSFYLNSSNPVIQALAKADFSDQLPICLALYNTSFMAAVPNLKDSERKSIYESIAAVYLSALKNTGAESAAMETESGSPASLQPNVVDAKDGLITVFMITPFSEPYRRMEEAIRAIFEAPPYFFRVLLARDYTYHSSLLRNVQAHIASADAFIADITELNPNVMLELGAVLLAGSGKPIFSLRGRSAKNDVPADLKSELYIPYGDISDQKSVIEQTIRSCLERDGRLIHDGIASLVSQRSRKALSKTVIGGLSYRLGEDEISSVLRNFDTLEEFVSTPRERIAKITGLKSYGVDALLGELHEVDKQ
jgi:molecular chaperone HtpG